MLVVEEKILDADDREEARNAFHSWARSLARRDQIEVHEITNDVVRLHLTTDVGNRSIPGQAKARWHHLLYELTELGRTPLRIISLDAVEDGTLEIEILLAGLRSNGDDETTAAVGRIPEADIEGFVDWVETEYSDNRWSDVHVNGNYVSVWSGEYPAYTRFISDLRPRAESHGLVMTHARPDRIKTGRGPYRAHSITFKTVAHAIAQAEDIICDRTVCTNLIAEAGAEYCEQCQRSMY
jgi:hypothetical protein